MNRSTLSGSCLCQSVTFEVFGTVEGFFLCHCSRCRKDTGSAHGANLFLPLGTLKWVKGEQCIKTYCLPETLHQKSFCGTCGSALPNVQMDGQLVVVPAGSLDTPVPIRPHAHICCSDRAQWDERLDTVPQVSGLPTD